LAEESKLTAREKKNAVAVVGKVTAHLATMRVVTGKSEFKNIPDMIRVPITTAEAKWKALLADAEER